MKESGSPIEQHYRKIPFSDCASYCTITEFWRIDIFIFISCAVVLRTVFCSQSGVDIRLSRPMSMNMVMQPLKEVIADLARESGERFQVEPDLAEHKVNLIFHDRTIADVMTALSECLWLDWAPLKGGGYKLYASQKLKSDTLKQLQFEKDEAVRAFRTRIARLTTYDRPVDDYYSKYGEALKTLASHGEAPFPGRDDMEHIVEDMKMPYWIPVGECLCAGPGDPVATLFDYGRLTASTDRSQQAFTLDPTRFTPFAKINGKPEAFTGCSCKLSWEPFRGDVRGRFLWEWQNPTVNHWQTNPNGWILRGRPMRGSVGEQVNRLSSEQRIALLGAGAVFVADGVAGVAV